MISTGQKVAFLPCENLGPPGLAFFFKSGYNRSTLEYNNEVYMAFFPAVSEDAQEGEPADIDLDDEEYGLIIMKVVEEDGEELLSTLDSDEELDLIYNQFMERLFADEEMED